MPEKNTQKAKKQNAGVESTFDSQLFKAAQKHNYKEDFDVFKNKLKTDKSFNTAMHKVATKYGYKDSEDKFMDLVGFGEVPDDSKKKGQTEEGQDFGVGGSQLDSKDFGEMFLASPEEGGRDEKHVNSYAKGELSLAALGGGDAQRNVNKFLGLDSFMADEPSEDTQQDFDAAFEAQEPSMEEAPTGEPLQLQGVAKNLYSQVQDELSLQTTVPPRDIEKVLKNPNIQGVIGSIKNEDINTALDMYNGVVQSLGAEISTGESSAVATDKILTTFIEKRFKIDDTVPTGANLNYSSIKGGTDWLASAIEEGVLTEEDLGRAKDFQGIVKVAGKKLDYQDYAEKIIKNAQAPGGGKRYMPKPSEWMFKTGGTPSVENLKSYYDLTEEEREMADQAMNLGFGGSEAKKRIQQQINERTVERLRSTIPDKYAPKDWDNLTEEEEQKVREYEDKLIEEGFFMPLRKGGDATVGTKGNAISDAYQTIVSATDRSLLGIANLIAKALPEGTVVGSSIPGAPVTSQSLPFMVYNSVSNIGDKEGADEDMITFTKAEVEDKDGYTEIMKRNVARLETKRTTLDENKGWLDLMANGEVSNIFRRTLQETAETAPVLATAGLATLATGGNVPVGAATMAALVSTETLLSVQDEEWYKELDTVDKAVYPLVIGGAEGLMMLPYTRLFKATQVGLRSAANQTIRQSAMDTMTKIGKSYGKTSLALAGKTYRDGFLTTMIQQSADKMYRDPDMTFGEYISNINETALSYAAMGLGSQLTVGLTVPARRVYNTAAIRQTHKNIAQISQQLENASPTERVGYMKRLEIELSKLNRERDIQKDIAKNLNDDHWEKYIRVEQAIERDEVTYEKGGMTENEKNEALRQHQEDIKQIFNEAEKIEQQKLKEEQAELERQEQQRQEADQEEGRVIEDISNLPSMTNTMPKIERGETVNDAEIAETEQEIFDKIEELENNDKIGQQEKEVIVDYLYENLEKLDNHEFRAKTETREITEDRAVQRPRKAIEKRQAERFFDGHPAIKDGETVTTTVDKDGRTDVIDKNGDSQGIFDTPSMEVTDINIDKSGNVSTIIVKDRFGTELEITGENALDLAIKDRMNKIGEVPAQVFKDAISEAEQAKTVELSVPYRKERVQEADKTTETEQEVSPTQEETTQETSPEQEINKQFRSKATEGLTGLQDFFSQRKADAKKRVQQGDTAPGVGMLLSNPQVELAVYEAAEQAIKAAKTVSEAVDLAVDAGINAMRETEQYKELNRSEKVQAESEVRKAFDVPKSEIETEAKKAKPKKPKKKVKGKKEDKQKQDVKDRLDELNKQVKDLAKEEVKEDVTKAQRTQNVSKAISDYIDTMPDFPTSLTSTQKKALIKRAAEAAATGTKRALEKFAQYAEKVVESKEFVDDVKTAKRAKKKADRTRIKKIAAKDYGASRSAINSVDPELLSPEVLKEYVQYLKELGQTQVYKHEDFRERTNKFGAIGREHDAIRKEEKAAEALKEIKPESKETAEARTTIGNSILEYAKAKKVGRTSGLNPAAQQVLKRLKRLPIKLFETELMEDIKSKVPTVNELSQLLADLQAMEAHKDADLGFSTISQQSYRTIEKMEDSYAMKTLNEVLKDKQFKKLLRDVLNPINLKDMAKKDLAYNLQNWMKFNPGVRLDAIMKGRKGRELYDILVAPAAQASSSVDLFVNEAEKADKKIMNKALNWKEKSSLSARKKVKQKSAMLHFIAAQESYQAAIDAGTSTDNLPTAKQIYDINEAASKEGSNKVQQSRFNSYESKAWESLPKTKDGNLDLEKAKKQLTKKELEAYEYFQGRAAELRPYAEAAAQKEGVDVDFFPNWTPLARYGEKGVFMELEEIKDASSAFSKDQNLNTSQQQLLSVQSAGNVKARVKSNKPFKMGLSEQITNATKGIMISYHLRDANRQISRLNGLFDKNKEVFSEDSTIFVKAFAGHMAKINENIFFHKFFGLTDPKMLRKAKNTMKELGYYGVLGSVNRSVVELTSNIAHALFDPKTFAKGVATMVKALPRSIDDYKGEGSSTLYNSIKETSELLATTQHDRLFFRGVSPHQETGISTGSILDATLASRTIKNLNKSTISVGDRVIALPMWTGAFQNSFKKNTGKDFDFVEFSKQGAYYNENLLQAEESRAVADQKVAQGYASMNPYEGILAVQARPDDGFFKMADKFMARFRIAEARSMFDAIDAMRGHDETMSRTGGAFLAAATLTRMTAYNLMINSGVNFAVNTAQSLLGTDYEEEDKDMSYELKRSIASALITPFLFRRLGNLATIPLAEGIEYMNFEVGANAGIFSTRESQKYNMISNAVVFTSIPRKTTGDVYTTKQYLGAISPLTIKGIGDYIIAGSAAYSNLLKSASRVVEYYSSTPKTAAARYRQRERFQKYDLPLFLMSSAPLAPFPKDIKQYLQKSAFRHHQEKLPKRKKSNFKSNFETNWEIDTEEVLRNSDYDIDDYEIEDL